MPAQALSATSSSGDEREADAMDRAETDDESLGDSEAKPKKLKKKKKKKPKEGEEGAVVKKKKKKKKKPVAEADADAEADETNADTAAGVTANSSTNDYEEPLQQASKGVLKMPVRRQSNVLDDVEISDVESDDDDATQKASGAPTTPSGKRSNSTGTYDQKTHARFLREQKARAEAERGSFASPPSNQIQHGFGDNDPGSASDDDHQSSYQNRPVRQRRGANEKRYKSSSMGALDKRKHQMLRKKQSIRIAPGSRRHMRYVSSDDDDSDDDRGGGRGYGSQDNTGSESEGEMDLGGGEMPLGGGGGRSSGDEIPSRPVRSSGGGGSGQAKYRSTSAGVLEKNVRDRFLDRHSNHSQSGTSDDEGSSGSGRPRRPVRPKRTSNQPRYRSNSAGILDKNARDIYNSRAPPDGSNFLKPRKRSAGAIKAKETLQRSAEASSLHQSQPNIRVALPRLRSVGALNARGSGSTSRRSSRDGYPSNSDDSNDDSPEARKVQSERVLNTKSFNSDDDSSSDGSSESDSVHVASAPLPKSFRPTRKWADASKQLDQLPSVRRTSSAQSVDKKPSATDAIAPPPLDDDGNGDIWTETLKDVAEKKKKKKKVKKKISSDDSLDSESDHKPKARKKKDKLRKSSAPGMESGSYH